jgi:hypothetical protein
LKVEEFDALVYKIDNLINRGIELMDMGKFKAATKIHLLDTTLFDQVMEATSKDNYLRLRLVELQRRGFEIY